MTSIVLLQLSLLPHFLVASRWFGDYAVTAVLAIVAAASISPATVSREWPRVLARASVGAVFLVAWGVFFTLGPERDELAHEGDGIVAALEGFQAREGHLPRSLADAGCVPPWNRFGGWCYEPLKDGASFHLWVGDYEGDGFILYRCGGDSGWSEDG